MIKSEFDLDFQWPVQEPFIFCVHHHDKYPSGRSNLGPDPKHLKGRNIGQDFEDYKNTQFGGWPWPQDEMVHGAALERFAKYPDGRIEKPKTSG